MTRSAVPSRIASSLAMSTWLPEAAGARRSTAITEPFGAGCTTGGRAGGRYQRTPVCPSYVQLPPRTMPIAPAARTAFTTTGAMAGVACVNGRVATTSGEGGAVGAAEVASDGTGRVE